MAFPIHMLRTGFVSPHTQGFTGKKKSTYKDWEEAKDLLFEAVLLLMSASKWRPEIRGAGNGKGGGKG